MFKLFGKQLRKPSGYWGKLVAKMMNKRNAKFYTEIIRILNVKNGEKVLEIGYGPGLGIHLLANSNTACSIHGIDFSELMYNEATKTNKTFIEQEKVNLICGDLLTTDFKNEKFDKIFCLNVIYFWDDLNTIFEMILSLLNKGGMFSIFMTHEKEFQNKKFAQDFCKYSIETVKIELIKAGFCDIDFKFENGYFITAIK